MKYAEYLASTDPNRFLDGCLCVSCSDAKVRARNLEESKRTKINAERGLAPAPKLDLQGNPTTVDWRKNLEELLPFVPLETAPTLDMQKNLRDYRKSMGNPMEPETPAEPKKGGYATLMTSMEMLTAFYPEQFPETPEQTESRRAREWKDIYKALKDEQDQFLVKRAEREKEQSIRRSERLRIAAILEDEWAETIAWLQGL